MTQNARSSPGQAAAYGAAAQPSHYSRAAIVLHWTTAALVLATIPLGLYGARIEGDSAQTATNIHKSIGILILLLTIVRLGWRLTHRPPPLPESFAPALRRIAFVTHVMFYALLLVLPLTGWWMSSAVPDPDRHVFGFGLFDVPFLPVPRGWASAGPAHFVHTKLALLMIALVVLHIAAALKHHLIDKDDIVARMLPRRS